MAANGIQKKNLCFGTVASVCLQYYYVSKMTRATIATKMITSTATPIPTELLSHSLHPPTVTVTGDYKFPGPSGVTACT